MLTNGFISTNLKLYFRLVGELYIGRPVSNIEMCYEDENIWLMQKMVVTLYNVDVRTKNCHIKKYLVTAN